MTYRTLLLLEFIVESLDTASHRPQVIFGTHELAPRRRHTCAQLWSVQRPIQCCVELFGFVQIEQPSILIVPNQSFRASRPAANANASRRPCLQEYEPK